MLTLVGFRSHDEDALSERISDFDEMETEFIRIMNEPLDVSRRLASAMHCVPRPAVC